MVLREPTVIEHVQLQVLKLTLANIKDTRVSYVVILL